MEIRNCLKEDLPAVHKLMVELSQYTDVSAPEQKEIELIFGAMNLQPEVYNNWVALKGGRVVGFLSLATYKTMLHPTGTSLINELVVDPSYRKLGIASALVIHAAQFARGAGVMEIEVGTEVTNKDAQKFYRKAGFNKEFLLFNQELV